MPVRPAPPRWGLAALLAAATLFTTTTMGAVYLLWAHPTRVSPIDWPFLVPSTIRGVWGDPELLALGLSFSLPALFILLCHEMGHYLACRHYRLPSTVPYFLPLPAALGTLGAFIRIRAPIRDRRQLFDVGVAGPLAGFAALLPFLLVGVARSEPVDLGPLTPPADAAAAAILVVPGRCVAIHLATLLSHGPLPPDTVLHLHPFALAAWFGLLVTAMNLLPVGQLDGGHVLYAVSPRLQHRLALPLWLLLAGAAFLFPGWLVWCVILLVIGLRHPPVVAEERGLGAGRLALAAVALAILALSFMPVPLDDVLVQVP
jgi:membrane-associated protease RseP (regulator of RpoE activity)